MERKCSSINSRIDQAEEKKTTNSKTGHLKLSREKGRRMKNIKESLWKLWDTIKLNNIRMWESHKEKKEREEQKTF